MDNLYLELGKIRKKYAEDLSTTHKGEKRDKLYKEFRKTWFLISNFEKWTKKNEI